MILSRNHIMRYLCCVLSLAIIVFCNTLVGSILTKPIMMETSNHFSFEILRKKLSEDSNENIVYSAFSIARALSMVYSGADGETKSQIGVALGWDKDEASSFCLLNQNVKLLREGKSATIAEHVWVEESCKILESYSKAVGNLESVSFKKHSKEEREKINQWIEKHTDGEIKDFFPDGTMNELTRLVLVNAILFKGLWKDPFKSEYTKPGVFFSKDGQNQQADFMFKNGEFRSIEEETFQMMEIPYNSDEFLFIATLPKEGLSVADFVNKMESSNNLSQKFIELKNVRGFSIDVFLPKFKVTEKIDLKELLPSMGIKDMFIANTADFSRITGDKSLFCSSAFHQASVEVNEEGTKASAATGFGMATMSLPPSIRFDRPFLFHVIHNKSNMFLFSGVINKFE